MGSVVSAVVVANWGLGRFDSDSLDRLGPFPLEAI